jgi:HrpA-like RNA helicase
VHERDLNTDFLLIILKKLLTFRPDLKVPLVALRVLALLLI